MQPPLPSLPHQPKRLEFLDGLRGVAALAVFSEHALGSLFKGFSEFHTHFFQIGQFGVSVFFLCSGFVIPYSLERTPSLKRFWVHRFFRLYPLYWASLAAALLLFLTHALPVPERFAQHFLPATLANLTMLQSFLGFEHALSPYWSLGYEMIFYFIISGLFFFSHHKKTLGIVSILMLGTVINPLLTRFVFHTPAHVGTLFHLTTLFFGTLIYRKHTGEVSQSSFLWALAAVLTTLVVSDALGFYGLDEPAALGTRSFLPMLTAWLAAYGLFLFAYFWRNSHFLRILTPIGVLSYSVYLIHPLVIGAVPRFSDPSLSFAVWSGVTWGLSLLTYRWIEMTGIRLGKAFK